jgi:hypothetical protein
VPVITGRGRKEYAMSRDVNEVLSVPFSKFYVAVARKVEAKCGLSPDDLPDVDFRGFYPGERATFGVYKAAIADCVIALLEEAGYPLEDEDYA